MRRALPICLLALAACDAGSRAPSTPHPPTTELLVMAGDSSYWITSDSTGLHSRGAPLFLARVDGRFSEIYVADDDRSFYDAVFVGQRIFSRDLLRRDSIALFQDTAVALAARAYAVAHPSERPLDPDEDASDNPRSMATTAIELLDVHGPFLSYEYHADFDLQGSPVRHDAHRGVLDLRTGARVTLARMFGDSGATRLTRAGLARVAALRDSIAAHPARPPAGAPSTTTMARPAGAVLFDALSFSLETVDDGPGIAFLVAGRSDSAGAGERGNGLWMPLEPEPAPGPAPAWWSQAREPLPTASDDSTDRWRHGSLELVSRADSDGDGASLLLRDTSAAQAGGGWSLGHLSAAAERVFWLDSPPLDSAARRALARAFDESALYDENARTVRATPRPALRVWRIVTVADRGPRPRLRGRRTSNSRPHPAR
jgi:hypothetical protein